MAEAKLAPKLPDWMVEHANRYLASGGTYGHMYRVTQPGRPDLTVPSLLLTIPAVCWSAGCNRGASTGIASATSVAREVAAVERAPRRQPTIRARCASRS